MKNDEVKLGSVQETLVLPLWGRTVETLKQKPLLIDQKAVSIIRDMPVDFTSRCKDINIMSQMSWIARSIFFDNQIREFIARYPEATVVNIGCGLDTTFDRVDNGKISWIDLDFPDTIELRRKYIEETSRRRFVAKSVLDHSWYNEVKDKSHVMLLIAGVIYYFDENEIKSLFRDFHTFLPSAEIILDYSSKKGTKLANKMVINKAGMDKSATMKWGVDDIREIENWDSYIKVISDMPMYQEHKKNFPFYKRIRMNIADRMKIMSLAHIRID